MTWNVPFESKTSRLCVVSVPATSMTPVHCPWDGIWWLSATLSVTLDGLSSVSLCLCMCHFDAHMVFFIAPLSITACMHTLSPFGPCSCTHLRYTQLPLGVPSAHPHHLSRSHLWEPTARPLCQRLLLVSLVMLCRLWLF